MKARRTLQPRQWRAQPARPASLRLQEAQNALALARQELEDGTALTTCPDCGSHSASSSEARANRRIGELERQNAALSGKLLDVERAIEELWLYPVENFPSGDCAADIRVFAQHTHDFAQQVHVKMEALTSRLAKLMTPEAAAEFERQLSLNRQDPA